MQAWPSYFTTMISLSGQTASSSSRLMRRPSLTEYGDAPKQMSVLPFERDTKARIISEISSLEEASITFSPAWKVENEAKC